MCCSRQASAPTPLPGEVLTVGLKGPSSPAVSSQPHETRVYHTRVIPAMYQIHISITVRKRVGLGLPHRCEHGSCLVYSFTQSRNSAWSLGRAARYIHPHSIAGLSACRGKSMRSTLLPQPGSASCPERGPYELVYSKNLLNFSGRSLRELPDIIKMQCKDVLSPSLHF